MRVALLLLLCSAVPLRAGAYEKAVARLVRDRTPLAELPTPALEAVARTHGKTVHQVLEDVGKGRKPPEKSSRGRPFGDMIPLPRNAQGAWEYRSPVDDSVLVRVPAERGDVLVGKHEVSVGRYTRFLDATGHRPRPGNWSEQLGRPEHPVTRVRWLDARAYARWAGCRLPTVSEWEHAAMPTGRAFPWGNLRPTRRQLGPPLPGLEDRLVRDSYVRKPGLSRLDTTPAGIRDMVWNAREWCGDEGGHWMRAVKGFSWTDPIHEVQSLKTTRYLRRDYRAADLSFRLARGPFHGRWLEP